MDELELVGLGEDGEHVVLSGPDGERFRLRIGEPLRAAVRRDRPQFELLRVEASSSLPPREIQSRIRAGLSAQAVADAAGLPLAMVRRYEGPVLAEREFIAAQARATRVGREAGSPVLGDLVADRLAARGVDVQSLEWDSHRTGSGPWTIVARFAVAETVSEARWTFDAAARAVVALEDEARWLSETELADEPIPRRHLSAVRDVVFDVQAGADGMAYLSPLEPLEELTETPEPDPLDATTSLLDDLQGKRGIRQELEVDDEDEDGEEFEGFGPQHAFDFAGMDTPLYGAHPADSDKDSARDARVLSMPEAHQPAAGARPEQRGATSRTASPRPVTPVALEPGDPLPDEVPGPVADRPRARRGRASVPSWDEIVFGAKPE